MKESSIPRRYLMGISSIPPEDCGSEAESSDTPAADADSSDALTADAEPSDPE